MKVDSTPRNGARTLQPGGLRAQPGDPAATTSAGTANAGGAMSPASAAAAYGGDANVNLSSVSSTLRAAPASDSADIDAAQVEAIRDAIRNGTLTIDTSKIADGVLQTARDLVKAPVDDN